MKCAEVQYRLTEDPSLRGVEDISEHLVSCPDCREFYRNMVELNSLTRELKCQSRAPKDFHLKVLGDFREQSDAGWFSARSILLSCSLVALLAGAVLAWDNIGNEGSLTAALMNPDDPEAAARTSLTGEPGVVPRDEDSFVEIRLESGDNEELILRLPPVIEIHRTETSDENTHYHAVSY